MPDVVTHGGAGSDIRRVVILGGGTAGWMTAAALATVLPDPRPEITLIESSGIGTVGVGEATLPTISAFNATLGIDERDFVARTEATFKLGILFDGWSRAGESFVHGFGDYGPPILGRSPHHQLLRMGAPIAHGGMDRWSAACLAAREGRFAPPADDPGSVLSRYSYAYHFDAGLYAAYLKTFALARGVRWRDERVSGGERAPDGTIAALRTGDGERIEGDFFVDCTGFRAQLIGDVLEVDWVDWGHWLPADRAWALPCASDGTWPPYTRSRATAGGWTWRIPLRHRTGNGHVFSSAHLAEEDTLAELTGGLEGAPAAEPRLIRFRMGRRARSWAANCVAIGLSAGFIEPLESTSISLIESAVGRLVQLFPRHRHEPALAAEYNAAMNAQVDALRDFIILHYHLSSRPEPFWEDMRRMALPASLAAKLDLWSARAEIDPDKDSFSEPSWLAILLGLGALPNAHDRAADQVPLAAVSAHFDRGAQVVARAVAALPSHRDYLSAFLSTEPR